MGCCCCKSKTQVTQSILRPETPDDGDDTLLHSDKGRLAKKRPSSVRPFTQIQRPNKVGISSTDPLLLIKGYEKEPLVSLDESLAPFDGRIQHLDAQIKQAKTHCRFPSDHHLTHDESAAIYLYSMRGDDNSVHEHLQRAWNTGDHSQMKPWFRYLRLLRSGLNKLPNAKGAVWQGTAYDSNLVSTLQSHSLPMYTCMGSCSTSMSDRKNDLNVKSGPRMVLVGYQSIDGKDVTGYTEGNGKEVMVWPGVKLDREKITEVDGHGALTAYLVGRTSKRILYVLHSGGTKLMSSWWLLVTKLQSDVIFLIV